MDNILHDSKRLEILKIMAINGYKNDFKTLKLETGFSDGSLVFHLNILAEQNIIKIKKTFKERKPHTTYALTDNGRKRLDNYLIDLADLLGILKKHGS